MINFIVGLYRNPKPGSVCWDPKIDRYINCISGTPRYVVSTILIVCAVATLAVLVGLAVDMIRGRI